MATNDITYDADGHPIVTVRPKGIKAPEDMTVDEETSAAQIDTTKVADPLDSIPIDQVDTDAVNTSPAAGTTNTTPLPLATAQNNFNQIQDALGQGYSRREVGKYLQDNLGVTEDDADKQVIESVEHKISDAKAQGYNNDEIKQFLIQNHYDGSIIDSAIKASDIAKPWKATDFDQSNQYTTPTEAKDIKSLYENIHGKYSTLGNQILGVFDEQKGIEARRDINDLNLSIATKLKENGIDAFINPNSGEVMMRDKSGVEQEVDSSFLTDFYNGKTELAGAVAGGIIGAKLGSHAPGRVKPWTMSAGAIGGSMIGASIGKAADMTINAAKLKENIEAELYMSQMKQAAIFDGIATVVGAGALKTVGAGAKGIMKAYKFSVAGNSKGAIKALLDDMNFTAEQGQEIVASWEKLNIKKASELSKEELAKQEQYLKLSPADKMIKVIASTQLGTEAYVGAAASRSVKLANTVIEDINSRAKSLNQAINTVSDDNVGALVRKDLVNYQADVKDFYDTVKTQGANAIKGTDFTFDLDKLAIKPVMETIRQSISNPIMRDRYIGYASKIEAASADRSFEGLINLRQAVNEFKYSKTGLRTPDLEALNIVLNKIDSTIGKAAKDYMPNNGKEWIDNFAQAKIEYAKMKVLEGNWLYKLVTRKGITEEGIQKALSKYGTNNVVNAETFNPLVERLAPATRAKVEVAAIKNMTNKYTLGYEVDKQAVHFPALANALQQLNINTSEGRNLVTTVDEFAKVFKNDVTLSKISGNIAVPQLNSSLSVNPVMKAKMETVGLTWSILKRLLPTKKSNSLALLSRVGKLLENPLNAKTVDAFMNELPKEAQPEMLTLIKKLQIETAKAPPVKQSDWLNMYKQSISGKMVVTNGALGKGVYLVDKVANPNAASKIIKHEVNLSRMATLEDISNLVGREITDKDIRTIPNLQQMLQDKKYLGIRVDGKAMLFPETTPGVKSLPPIVKKVQKK